MTRTERQRESIKRWIAHKGRGSIEAATGFGKSRIGLMTIKALLKKYPQFRILVVVPTTGLKTQWEKHINEWDFVFNVEVKVINTIIKHSWQCDLLLLDECHRFSSDDFSQIFQKVKYKLILGLTATFERLDGKHVIMQKYCPIVDCIPVLECQANGWVADYKEYVVLIDVDDISEFKTLNKEFIRLFEFFNFDFDSAKKCCGKDGWKYAINLADQLYKGNDENKKKEFRRAVMVNAIQLMRNTKKRKLFINNHPKKIQIARKIIESRLDKKIITFSNNVNMAESIGFGEVYTGRLSKKRSDTMIEEFNSMSTGVLNTCAKANEGLDIHGLSVAIILGTDSSETKARQRRGRTIRKEENKVAEIFYIVIRDTTEEKWVKNNHKTDRNYITIDENGLNKVLKGEIPEPPKQQLKELMFRF